MSVVDSLIQRKAGLPSAQRELNNQALTAGHSASQGGLRGHSLGPTYPYRVVGKGDGTWEVHANHTPQRMVGMTCTEAHEFAQRLADKGGLYHRAFTSIATLCRRTN